MTSDVGVRSAVMEGTELDPAEVGLFAFQVFSKLEGAVTAGMIHLGDRLGLYSALADADHPLSTTELAERTGLQERWVREWAYNQGAAQVVAVDARRAAVAHAGGGRRAGRSGPSRLRHGAVQPPPR